MGLIHSDISGPIPIKSINGSRYVLNFIDYFLRYTSVFFIKKKSEVLEKFTELKALIENASGKKVKILRSDNGGEYVSNELLHMLPKWYSGPAFNSLHSSEEWCSGKEELVSQGDEHLYVGIKEVG